MSGLIQDIFCCQEIPGGSSSRGFACIPSGISMQIRTTTSVDWDPLRLAGGDDTLAGAMAISR